MSADTKISHQAPRQSQNNPTMVGEKSPSYFIYQFQLMDDSIGRWEMIGYNGRVQNPQFNGLLNGLPFESLPSGKLT